MSTITKQWLQQKIAEMEENRDLFPGDLDDDDGKVLAALRIALASLEAEPVGEVVLGEYDDCGCHPDAKAVCIAADGQADWENFKDGTRLYTSPPAPVSVPEPIKRNDADGWWMYKGRRVGGGCAEWYNRALDDCRATMLQGAEHVTTDYKLPIQPLVIDAHGTLRFKENPIVRVLLDYATEHGYGLNEIALEEFDAEDQMQLAQLIGYSLSGYGTLSYVTDESYERAAAAAPQQEA